MKAVRYEFRKGGFWLRIFGVGVSVINRKLYCPPFSVRNGFVKEWRIGNYGIKFLGKI